MQDTKGTHSSLEILQVRRPYSLCRFGSCRANLRLALAGSKIVLLVQLTDRLRDAQIVLDVDNDPIAFVGFDEGSRESTIDRVDLTEIATRGSLGNTTELISAHGIDLEFRFRSK